MTTNEFVAGKKVRRTLGLVRGSSIRTRHFGHDLMAKLRGLVGGEIPEYTKMLAEVREQALDRMLEEAQQLGADAILEVRFGTSQLMGGAAELLVYGTAVQLEEAEPHG